MDHLLKKKIDFLVIGTQKSGTTALDKYLRLHAEIGMPQKKETHFFDKHIKGLQGEMIDQVYHNHFNLEDIGTRVVGEITPGYMYLPQVCERVYQYNPKLKLIAILRNPIDRAYSHWGMQKERGLETLSFDECIENEPQRLSQIIPKHRKKFAYLARGYYAEQLKRYFKLFAKDQFHIIKYEEFLTNQQKTLNGLFDFLNIDSSNYPFEEIMAHQTSYEEAMSSAAKDKLIELFTPEVKELEELLQWDCQHWLQ